MRVREKNIDYLLKDVEGFMEEGPMFFPEDMITDFPERFIVSEIIREKVLNYLDEEVDRKSTRLNSSH